LDIRKVTNLNFKVWVLENLEKKTEKGEGSPVSLSSCLNGARSLVSSAHDSYPTTRAVALILAPFSSLS
jgi:hypothetical protein